MQPQPRPEIRSVLEKSLVKAMVEVMDGSEVHVKKKTKISNKRIGAGVAHQSDQKHILLGINDAGLCVRVVDSTRSLTRCPPSATQNSSAPAHVRARGCDSKYSAPARLTQPEAPPERLA